MGVKHVVMLLEVVNAYLHYTNLCCCVNNYIASPEICPVKTSTFVNLRLLGRFKKFNLPPDTAHLHLSRRTLHGLSH